MANKTDSDVTVIKKYANRRLYHTGTSTYVTLDDLAEMVKSGESFAVQDAKSGSDITHSVLTQIIFEQEGKTGQTMLPVPFLRQLISFYGDHMQAVVPSYLEASMSAFGQEQERIREQMASMVGKTPVDMIASSQQMVEEQTRKNMTTFTEAMKMFNPFMAGLAAKTQTAAPAKATEELKADGVGESDLETMRQQIAQMQSKLDKLD